MRYNNNDGPLVSIIIPVYNGEDYISLAIQSALRQTYKNIEIIVVDDGSIDKTSKICKSYGNLIRYIRKENGGVSSALNVGIENMNGEYFNWLSHDDIYLPNKVEIEIDFLKKNKLLGTNTIVFSDHGVIDEKGNCKAIEKKFSSLLNTNPIYPLYRSDINGLTLLIPKNAFDNVGLFDCNLKCVQDYQLWFDMYKYGYNFIHIPYILTFTRVHSKSTTNTSPLVKSEGNNFWINYTKYFSNKQKIDLEGNIYNYYNYLYNRHARGFYDEFVKYCFKEKKKYEKNEIDNLSKYNICVLISFHNDIDNLIKSIKSVLNQTFSNFKLLLINDNSEVDISRIKKIIRKNDKIINVSPTDDISNIINLNVTQENCDYICFLEPGSEFRKNKLKNQLTKLLASNYSISHSAFYDSNNKKSGYSGILTGLIDVDNNNLNSIDFSTIMISKKLFLKYSKKYFYLNDYYNFIKTILKDNRILGIYDDVLSKVPVHKIYKPLPKVDIYKDILNELNRYKIQLTKEYKISSKIRKFINKVLVRKNKPEYLLSNKQLKSGKIIKIVKKYGKIKNSIFVRSKKK